MKCDKCKEEMEIHIHPPDKKEWWVCVECGDEYER